MRGTIDDILTVFVAELLRRIRSRAFIIGLLMGLVALFAITRLPFLMVSAYQSSKTVVIVGDPRLASAAKPLVERDYDVSALLDPQSVTPRLLRKYDAAAAIVLSTKNGGLDVTVDTRDPSSLSVGSIRRDLLPLQLQVAMHRTASDIDALSTIPVAVRTIGSKFTSTAQAQTAQGVAYTLIFFLYILILGNSQLVTTSVAEEKSSRIAELLVASVDPSALLAGKVFAGAVLAVIQLVVWLVAGVAFGGGVGPRAAAVAAANPFSLGGIGQVISPMVVIAFLLFFIIGFLQLSTVLAAFASLVNRTEDLGSIIGPLVLSLVTALFVSMAALGAPEASWAVGASFVPLFAPFVMFARIAVSDVPAWQIVLSLAINLVALWLIAIFAGKLYRVGMLLYGRTPKLTQILTVLRSH
jgi:ABC-2 type transport system permease protein